MGATAFAADPAPPASPPKDVPPAAPPSKTVPPHVPRKTIPIARQWNLTAEKHDRKEMDGTRIKLLVSTGHPTLKHGPDMFHGPWDIDAHAEEIDADFEQKKFILRGTPVVAIKDPKTKATLKTYTGAADAVIEIGLESRAIEVSAGAVKEDPAPAPAPPSRPSTGK